jgi:hypothetical protein
MMRIKGRTPMFSLKRTEEEPRPLEVALNALILQLGDYPGNSKEYTAIANNVRTLTEAAVADKTTNRRQFVSEETKATIAANLAGILMILSYERGHVLTSKALSMLHRVKT